MTRTFCNINPHKAAGPDGVPGRVLRNCAGQLTGVLTHIVNLSLSSFIVPVCFKTSTIIPIPKKSVTTCHNDYRPVALTPITAKCLERLILSHIRNYISVNMDQLQFAYKVKRSTGDAIYMALEHLEETN